MNDHDPIASPPLRPVRGAALCAIGAFVLAAVAWLLRAVWQLRLSAAGMPASGPPDQSDGASGSGMHRPLNSLENSYHMVTNVGDAVTILCMIAFLAWLWNARDNAGALSGRPARYGWPWVYLSWIIPIVNLWIPRGIIADIHRASAPDERLPRVVNWWWGLWLAGMVSGVGLMYADSTDKVIERAYDGIAVLLVSDAAVIGAAIAAIFVVRALTATQQRHLDGSTAPGGAG